jgi:hypothetical protein
LRIERWPLERIAAVGRAENGATEVGDAADGYPGLRGWGKASRDRFMGDLDSELANCDTKRIATGSSANQRRVATEVRSL